MKRSLLRCAVVLLVLTATGCTVHTRTPAESPAPTTLVLAHIDSDLRADPAAQWFADEVARASNGELVIEFANSCCTGEADNQSVLVDGVASGDFDLGWLAVRGLQDLGVTKFEALEAPLLIDRYAAQAAVLESDIPARLLSSLDTLGVTGIALEPGMLHRPIISGVVPHTPSDFAGLNFWTASSAISVESLSALGATPRQVSIDERNRGLKNGEIDAVENPLSWQAETQQVKEAVTTRNTALWARFSVLIANPRIYGGLTSEQSRWLNTAATAVSKSAMDVAAVDASAIEDFCANGSRFFVLTPTERLQWEAALAPVYAKLESHPETAILLEELRTLIPEIVENEVNVPHDCYAL